MRVIALIPAYNEEETIGGVIKDVKKYVNDIVVIDDVSKDNTVKIARESGVNVVEHKINRGYGAAQRTGHTIAMRENFDYVIQIDGDGQHDPKYIPLLLEAAQEGYDIVLGSRFLNISHKKYSFTRRLGIKFFTFLVNFLSSANITDVTSGFKVFKVESLKKLSRTSDRHPAVEQMLEASRMGFKIKEISIEMPPRKKGESLFNMRTFIMYPIRMIETVLRVLLFRRQ